MKLLRWFLLVMLFITEGCKEKYVSGIAQPSAGYLVVEGFINAGNGPTTISLTRTATLDSASIIPEAGAQVEIQSSDGAGYPLTEINPGKYYIDQLTVNPLGQYRLSIKTADGKQYISDTSSVIITPPIDTIMWNLTSDGIGILVSAHDDQAKSRYYKWSFNETWQYNASNFSNYEYDLRDSQFFPRPAADALPNVCWSSDSSNTILISSSAQLSKDVISMFPITSVSYFTTNKLVSRYSILVKQTVLSKAWYEWVQKVQKNTEQLGSIFDAQPSQTGGNFHCISNPNETVIGFVGCTSETEKRIFISRDELSSNVAIHSGYENCGLRVVPNIYDSIKVALGYEYISDLQFDASNNLTGALFAPIECVDCRVLGGVKSKPDFW